LEAFCRDSNTLTTSSMFRPVVAGYRKLSFTYVRDPPTYMLGHA